MSKGVISKEQVLVEFNRDSQHIVYLIAIRQLELYLTRTDVLPTIVNNIVRGARAAGRYDRETKLNLFGKEMRELLGDTKLWNHNKPASSLKITSDIMTGTILDSLVKNHLNQGTEMFDPVVVEETDEERANRLRNEGLAKGRETIRLNREKKKAEEEALRLVAEMREGRLPKERATQSKVVFPKDKKEELSWDDKYSNYLDGKTADDEPIDYNGSQIENESEFSAEELEFIKAMNGAFSH